MGGSPQTGTAIHRRAIVVAAAPLSFSRVQAHAHAHGRLRGPGLGDQRALERTGTGGPGEDGEDGFAVNLARLLSDVF